MTWDQRLATAYLLWLVFTAVYIGVVVGRQSMRSKLTKVLAQAIRDGNLIPTDKRVVGK